MYLKAVAHPINGLDVAPAAVQFAAEVLDVGVHGPLISLIVVAPNSIEQLLSGKDAPLVAQETLQQIKFPPGQLQALPGGLHLPLLRDHEDFTGLNHISFFSTGPA